MLERFHLSRLLFLRRSFDAPSLSLSLSLSRFSPTRACSCLICKYGRSLSAKTISRVLVLHASAFVLDLQRSYASINESLLFLPLRRIPYGPCLANLFLPLKVSALVLFFLSRQSSVIRPSRFNLSHSAILLHSLPPSSSPLRPLLMSKRLLYFLAAPYSRTRSPSRTLYPRSRAREENPR